MKLWNKTDYLFPIDDAYKFGMEMTSVIDETIEGGCGCPEIDGGILAQAVKNAGDGDYLELGTLFGASAILASLTKKKFGLKGDVYCIDDLTARSNERSVGTIMNNAEKMGASIILKVARTDPFPYPRKRFNCVLIDADHRINAVFMDWVNVRMVATKYVLFHDYDPSWPGVMSVVKLASFYPVHISGFTAVLENLVYAY